MKLFLVGCLAGMFATFILMGLSVIFRDMRRKRHEYTPQAWKKISRDKGTEGKQFRGVDKLRVEKANAFPVSVANLKPR